MPIVDDIGRTIASTRQEALQLGLTLYQGAPCQSALHECSIRYASNRACEDCTWDRNRIKGTRSRKAARERKRAQRARARERAGMVDLEQSPVARLYLAILATGRPPAALP